jgi:hypothetical protein
MEYKKSSYFNTEDTYVFESSLNDVFESKVEFYNGIQLIQNFVVIKQTVLDVLKYNEY